MVQHIIPKNDLFPHEEVEDIRLTNGKPWAMYCHCSPEYKEIEGNIIVIHNSFDGREGVEWAKEILNQ